MATTDRQTPEHLSFLARVAENVRRWGLFPVLRGAEARAYGLPRIGRSKLPSQNIADLGQTPSMSFADSTLDSIEFAHGRAKIMGPWMGLRGPMGPLPIHLTEFAYYEQRYADAKPFGRFLDVIAGRMLQLFYRAWAESQPAAILDRPDDDRFGDYVAALSGSREGATSQSVFPAQARLHYAALFASRRSVSVIEDGVGHLLCRPVRIREYQQRWRDLDPQDRTRLGGGYCALGENAILGGRVLCATDAFRVVIGTKNFSDYRSLLPGAPQFEIAAEALDALTPGHLEWDVELEIEQEEVSPARLDGRAQLGWTSWLGASTTNTQVRCDAHLRRSAAFTTPQTNGLKC